MPHSASLHPQDTTSPCALQPIISSLLSPFPSSQNIEQYITVHGAKLVVIDSIAALTRLDYSGRDGAVERAEVLGQVAVQLKNLAESFRLPVLVVNQVCSFSRWLLF